MYQKTLSKTSMGPLPATGREARIPRFNSRVFTCVPVIKSRPRVVASNVAAGILPDAVVTARVAAALRSQMTSGNAPVDVEGADLIVRGVGIRVGTSAGTVRLMGVVLDANVVTRAEAVVRTVDGVRSIDNRLVSGGMLDFD